MADQGVPARAVRAAVLGAPAKAVPAAMLGAPARAPRMAEVRSGLAMAVRVDHAGMSRPESSATRQASATHQCSSPEVCLITA